MSDLDNGVIILRTLHTDFADKVDLGSDGKLNIIGLYDQGVMDLCSSDGTFIFPGVDLKVTIESPVSQPIEQLVIFVFFNEELIARTEFSVEELSRNPMDSSTRIDCDAGLNVDWFGWGCHIQPRVLASDGLIRVRALTERGVMAGGALKIRLVDEDRNDAANAAAP